MFVLQIKVIAEFRHCERKRSNPVNRNDKTKNKKQYTKKGGLMRKNAFTLTETLLMVAVVGIIAVISAVSLKNITPDKDVVMIRKAYTDVSKAVAVLVNNQDLYPYARVAMKNVDSKLNPMWQSVAAASCEELLLSTDLSDSRLNDENKGMADNLQQYQLTMSCGGGGGGGGGTTSTSSSSSLTSSTSSSSSSSSSSHIINKLLCELDTRDTTTCPEGCYLSSGVCYHSELLTSSSFSSSSSSFSSSNSCATSACEYRELEVPVDAGSDNISKGSDSVSGSNLQDGTYADKPLQQEGSSVDLAAHGSVFLNTAVMDGSTAYTSNNKFAYNFAKLFKSDDLYCSGRVCEFTTPDGMEWTVTDNFSVAASQTATIKVDINGSSAGANSSTADKPDIYTFTVDASGAVTISGNDAAATKAKRVLKDRKAKK